MLIFEATHFSVYFYLFLLSNRICGCHCSKYTVKYQAQKSISARQWWHTPLIPALGRQRQVTLNEFKVSLVYNASSTTARIRNPVLKKQNKTKNPRSFLDGLVGSLLPCVFLIVWPAAILFFEKGILTEPGVHQFNSTG